MFQLPRVFIFVSLIMAANIGFIQSSSASGGGSMSMPSSSMPEQSKPLTAEEKAAMAYNAGISLIKDADEAVADAAKATDPKKRQKAQDHAKKYFNKAQAKFESAVELYPNMFQAWNYIGYSKRNLGDYSGALEAYDRALKLNPRYVEAIEYRGHAYLGLNRVDDVKQTYLILFANNRALADKLLVAMQSWVNGHRSDAQGVDTAIVEDFAKWVDERGSIAANTTGLTPNGSAEAWH